MPDDLPVAPDASPALALVGQSLCEAADRLDAWSRILLLASFLSGLWGAPVSGVRVVVMAAALACALGEAWFAWRLAFDRPVFAAWTRLDGEKMPVALRAFDAALFALLRKKPPDTLRPLGARVAGVRRLLVCQGAAFAGQVAVLLVLSAGVR